MQNISLGALENGPHANLIHTMAQKCVIDTNIQAIWVGGSLAAGHGDAHSDIDFRIAVEPEQINNWISPIWEKYLPISLCESILMRFGDHALLHHIILIDGTIVDFYVQDTTHQNSEPYLIILACRNAEFRKKLQGFERPIATLEQAIDPAKVRQFLVDYWITTHKQIKALARKYDYSPFVGLYFERVALLRAWYMQIVGKDIHSRVSLHMLGLLHKGLNSKLSEQQQNLLGLPSRTPLEAAIAIEAIRIEMARIGRSLASTHTFAYPHELENVVQKSWHEQKATFIKR